MAQEVQGRLGDFIGEGQKIDELLGGSASLDDPYITLASMLEVCRSIFLYMLWYAITCFVLIMLASMQLYVTTPHKVCDDM